MRYILAPILVAGFLAACGDPPTNVVVATHTKVQLFCRGLRISSDEVESSDGHDAKVARMRLAMSE